MKIKFNYLLFALLSACSLQLKAQVYQVKISKDSLAILVNRLEALKVSKKIHELKVDEAKEEAEVEKLRVKLLEANDKAKDAAEVNKNAQKPSDIPLTAKELEKLSKKAKDAEQDAQKALERYNKQIAAVEKLRAEIRTEERSAKYKKPLLVFNYQ